MINQPIGQRAQPEKIRTATEEIQAKLADQEHQTGKAIKFRHYQRWFFYVIIAGLFMGAVAMIVKTNNDNSKLLASISTINTELTQKKDDIEKIKQSLTGKDKELQAAGANLSEVQTDLAKKIENLQTIADKNDELETEIRQIKISLDSAQANITNLILETAVKLDPTQVAKIALADVKPDTLDSDDDGLSDELEQALGTDPNKADSDDDGYSDQAEIIGGFNPLGEGSLSLDNKLAGKYKGRLILEDNAYAWYIGQNAKKYFLGSLANKFSSMQQNKYWSRKN